MQEFATQVEAVRQFGRFYTRQIGVLSESLLDSQFTLPEARTIYEIAHQDAITARGLADELRLDTGYVSRILARLESAGVVTRVASPSDRRVKFLSLTAAGKEAFARLDTSSRDQIGEMLSDLSGIERQRLVHAMRTVESVLTTSPQSPVPYVLRPHQPGDMGWVVHRHGVLYSQEYGWDERFEALVADIVAKFIHEFKPKHERCWIAERDGENVGCVFLVQKSESVAQLRLLLVEPDTRGLGIGARLVKECTRFATRVGYQKIMLWTNDVLHSARRIYEGEGYRLVDEEPHESFGHELVGQFWELELAN